MQFPEYWDVSMKVKVRGRESVEVEIPEGFSSDIRFMFRVWFMVRNSEVI